MDLAGRKARPEHRLLLGGGAYFTQLLGDDIVAKSFMAPIAQPGEVEAQICRLGGFDIFETVILPQNDEAGAVTDPETGLTFGYLRYTECTTRKR